MRHLDSAGVNWLSVPTANSLSFTAIQEHVSHPLAVCDSPLNNTIEYTMFSLYNRTNLRLELATCPKEQDSLRDLCACGGFDL